MLPYLIVGCNKKLSLQLFHRMQHILKLVSYTLEHNYIFIKKKKVFRLFAIINNMRLFLELANRYKPNYALNILSRL